MDKTTKQKTETKHVKHTFTMEERNSIGADLARAIAQLRGTEAEFDQVKASYKAKTAAGESQIEGLSTSLMNGFELRNKTCLVVYRPADKKKDYFVEIEKNIFEAIPCLTEDMTREDFQADLIQAESKFELKEEIEIFPSVNGDGGILVVGRLGNKWFSAIRIKVGKNQVEQRLDSEQRAYKLRADAVKQAAKNAQSWFVESLGKDNAKGFDEMVNKVVEANKDRVE